MICLDINIYDQQREGQWVIVPGPSSPMEPLSSPEMATPPPRFPH